MKRQQSDTESLVYAYGCAAPIDGLDHVLAEAERQRALWDRLVDIERRFERQQLDAAARENADLAALVSEIDLLSAHINSDDTTRTERTTMMRRRRDLDRQTWPMIAAWRKMHQDDYASLEFERRKAVVVARQETSAYWGNYNRVISDYERSRLTVRQFGRRLRHANPIHERGCLTVQIQRTKTGLGAAPAELHDGSFNHLRIGLVDHAAHDLATFRGERRRLCRTTLDIRVDAVGNMARLPMIYHRPVPEGCRIKVAQLVWRKIAGRTVWRLALTISRTREQRAPEGTGMTHLRLCYEALPDGSLLVAQYADGSLALNRDWMRGMDRVALLESAIDRAFDRLGTILVARTPDEYADLLLARLKAGEAVNQEEITWRKLHVGWRREADNLRQKLIGRRTEEYRLFARAVCMRYAEITVEHPLLAVMAQADRDAPINALRQRAALSTLLSCLEHQAKKHGCSLTIASAHVPERVDGRKIRKISRAQREQLRSARKSASDDDENQAVA